MGLSLFHGGKGVGALSGTENVGLQSEDMCIIKRWWKLESFRWNTRIIPSFDWGNPRREVPPEFSQILRQRILFFHLLRDTSEFNPCCYIMIGSGQENVDDDCKNPSPNQDCRRTCGRTNRRLIGGQYIRAVGYLKLGWTTPFFSTRGPDFQHYIILVSDTDVSGDRYHQYFPGRTFPDTFSVFDVQKSLSSAASGTSALKYLSLPVTASPRVHGGLMVGPQWTHGGPT